MIDPCEVHLRLDLYVPCSQRGEERVRRQVQHGGLPGGLRPLEGLGGAGGHRSGVQGPQLRGLELAGEKGSMSKKSYFKGYTHREKQR